MCSKLAFGVLCVVVYTAVTDSAALSEECNQIPIEGEIYDYLTLQRNYTNFTVTPIPCKVVVRTRELIKEDVKKVQPLGVILRRCPKTLPTKDNWFCESKNNVQVTLKVRINREGDVFKFYNITTTEDISCRCSPHQGTS